MGVLAIVDDLLFRSKIETAASQHGVALTIASDPEAIAPLLRTASWSRVIIDLHFSAADPLRVIAMLRAVAPRVPILGYGSHVEVALQRQALDAGCTQVLPRSVFVRRLPELLAGK